MVTVIIGADHAGVAMKKFVISLLKGQDLEYLDLGSFSANNEDDYPAITERVCKEVLKDVKHRVGILVCGSGIGVCIAANRFRGIRAALCWNVEAAYLSRKDDHVNVLCLAGQIMSEEQVEGIVKTWFTTPAADAERYVRRIIELDRL